MKTKVFALLAVLLMFVGVGVSSCDKSMDEPRLSQQDEQPTQSSFGNLRATAGDAYKYAYVHKPHDYGIIAGFCAAWNTVKAVDYPNDNSKPSLTITGMAQTLGVTPTNPQVNVENMVNTYSWTGATRLNIYTNGAFTVEQQVGQYLNDYLSKPMLVLIQDYNSTLNKHENVFAVVFTYSGGTVYYTSPFTRGSGTGLWNNLSDLPLSEFVQKAQAAIDGSMVRIMKFQLNKEVENFSTSFLLIFIL